MKADAEYVTKKDFNKRFDKLEGYLESSFGAIAQQFESIDRRFESIDRRFEEVIAEQKKQREDIRKIMGFLDSIAKRQEINDDERLVMGHQIERLDKWVHQLADRVGVKLKT